MTGSIAANFYEGSRSEILAHYLFSTWGAVSPVLRQSDYGIDLYCTLTERVGRRARVRDYFSVQVKSTQEPWIFNDQNTVKWLLEYPVPLFLCTVDKKKALVRVYHLASRFEVWALGELPDKIELTPGKGPSGKAEEWRGPGNYSFSAPIIEAGLQDFLDTDRMEKLQRVFASWVDNDRDNLTFIRQGLLRFRRPMRYQVNEVPTIDVQEERRLPNRDMLKRGLFRLAEAISCLGGQVAALGDRAFALQAALLLDRIQTEYEDVFAGDRFWDERCPGWLGFEVIRARCR